MYPHLEVNDVEFWKTPLANLYWYPGPVPVVGTAMVIEPLVAVKQVGFTVLAEAATKAVGCVIVALVVAVHEFASVTVNEYVPLLKPEKAGELPDEPPSA